jgi:MFS family permease
MGLNTSYQSIGMISGPILGGIVTSVTLPSPFFVGSLLLLLWVYISRQTIRTGVSAKSAFNEFRK